MDGNAPPVAGFETLARTALRVWPGNPRKTVEDVTELAESIRGLGILEPLLVRPLAIADGDVTHEVLAGQRRYLAAGVAAVDLIPCIVRDVPDDVALELSLAENAGRAEVHPLEEAEAIGRLVTEHHRTPQQVADKLGRPLRWVQKRLSLQALCPEARAEVTSGRLPLAHAERLASIDAAAQVRVLAKFPPSREIPTAREFARWISYELHALSGAPFDVKDGALPGHGPCGTCPHRSDVQTDLLGDVAEGAHCLDTACWDGKVTATWDRAVKSAKRRHLEVLPDAQGVVGESWDGQVYDLDEGAYTPEKPSDDAKSVAITRTERGTVVELYARPTPAPGAEGTEGGEDLDDEDPDGPTGNAREATYEKCRAEREATERAQLSRLVTLASNNDRARSLLGRAAIFAQLCEFGDRRELKALLDVLGCPCEAASGEDETLTAAIPEVHVGLVLTVLAAAGRLRRLVEDADGKDAAPFERELLALLNPTEATAAPEASADTRHRQVTVKRSVWQQHKRGLLDGKGLAFLGRWEARGSHRVLTTTPGPDLDAVLAFCAEHDLAADVAIEGVVGAPETPAKNPSRVVVPVISANNWKALSRDEREAIEDGVATECGRRPDFKKHGNLGFAGGCCTEDSDVYAALSRLVDAAGITVTWMPHPIAPIEKAPRANAAKPVAVGAVRVDSHGKKSGGVQ